MNINIPIGILNIMKAQVKNFPSATYVTDLINAYFASVGIEANAAPKTKLKAAKPAKKPLVKRLAKKPAAIKYDPPTITGLALYLGFNTLEELEYYENNGRYAIHLKRARLLVAAAYEKKLHSANPSGAIFAIKNLGMSKEKDVDKIISKIPSTLKVEIIESGPKTAGNEKDVILNS